MVSAALGLHCRVRAFSSCGERGLLSQGSVPSQQRPPGLDGSREDNALQHVGSSWTRDRIHVPRTDRWIPNQWTIREILPSFQNMCFSWFVFPTMFLAFFTHCFFKLLKKILSMWTFFRPLAQSPYLHSSFFAVLNPPELSLNSHV